MPNEVFEITEKAVTKFQEGVGATQNGIIKKINGTLKKLEIDSQGNVKVNQANLRILRTLREDLVKIIINPAYKKKLETYLLNFNRIKRVDDEYFKSIKLPNFNPNRQAYREILNGNIGITRASLTESGIINEVVMPVVKLLEQGITTGIAFDDLEAALRLEIIGGTTPETSAPPRLGRFERYTKQITRDALNQYSRNYVATISNEYEMEWYFYDGSNINDTREFCRKRSGKYWHKKEVESWSSERWNGKIPSTTRTSIFIYAGGYSCRHSIDPVLLDVVPKSVIQRNIRNKNYNPPST